MWHTVIGMWAYEGVEGNDGWAAGILDVSAKGVLNVTRMRFPRPRHDHSVEAMSSRRRHCGAFRLVVPRAYINGYHGLLELNEDS